MAGSVELWAAVLSNSPALWLLTFDLWLARRTCLTSPDNWRQATGVRDKSSVSEKWAWDDARAKITKISNSQFKAFVTGSVRQRHAILDMKHTHWFALGQGGVAGLAEAFALWLAGEGWSARGLEAAAGETISAGYAQQCPEVGNILAERWPERNREQYSNL